MGADQLNDLHVANLTTPLHWSNVNPATQTEYAWHQTGRWPVRFRTNHLDMQLPPAPKLFLSPGRGHPFIWGLQIKQVSWLINLTDRAYCGQCLPKRKPYCLLSRRLTFLLFFDSFLYNGSHRANLVIDLKKTASSRQVIEFLKQKLCLFPKRLQFI